VLVDTGPLRFLLSRSGTCRDATAEHGRFLQRAIQRRLRLLQCDTGAATEHALAGETADIHLDIGRQQHRVGFLDGLGVEHVARAHRAARLHLQVVALARGVA